MINIISSRALFCIFSGLSSSRSLVQLLCGDSSGSFTGALFRKDSRQRLGPKKEIKLNWQFLYFYSIAEFIKLWRYSEPILKFFSLKYSRHPKIGHVNMGNIQNPDNLESGLWLSRPVSCRVFRGHMKI